MLILFLHLMNALRPSEDFKYQEEALERTHRWAEKGLKEHKEIGKSEEAAFYRLA